MSFQIGDWVIVKDYEREPPLNWLSRPAEIIEGPQGYKYRVTWPQWGGWYAADELRKACPLEILAGQAE